MWLLYFQHHLVCIARPNQMEITNASASKPVIELQAQIQPGRQHEALAHLVIPARMCLPLISIRRPISMV
jgi:hypothetical protein